MEQLGVAFITGLTAGGLSCVALQGGLLASVILDEEKEYLENEQTEKAPRARPVILFLISKIIVYTILGFILGLLGSFISLSPLMRGWLQIIIGIFILGVALNILNVHPIFRFFSLQPPKFIRKYIRKQTKNKGDVGAIFMGGLTVFLPCAVTQAMMLTAISTGNGLSGAALMFAFILGTSPIFFIIGYTATALSEKFKKNFLKLAAVLVIVTGIFSITTGATLAGVKIPQLGFSKKDSDSCQGEACNVNETSNTKQTGPTLPENKPSEANPQTENVQEVTINLTDNGYEPDTVKVKKGSAVKVTLKTNGTYGCVRAFVVPSLNIQKILPKTGEDSFEFTPTKTGSIDFTCSMGMYYGSFIVE